MYLPFNFTKKYLYLIDGDIIYLDSYIKVITSFVCKVFDKIPLFIKSYSEDDNKRLIYYRITKNNINDYYMKNIHMRSKDYEKNKIELRKLLLECFIVDMIEEQLDKGDVLTWYSFVPFLCESSNRYFYTYPLFDNSNYTNSYHFDSNDDIFLECLIPKYLFENNRFFLYNLAFIELKRNNLYHIFYPNHSDLESIIDHDDIEKFITEYNFYHSDKHQIIKLFTYKDNKIILH